MSKNFNTPTWFQKIHAAWRALHLRPWCVFPPIRLCGEEKALPTFVKQCPITMEMRPWLQSFDWSVIPELPSGEFISPATYIAAYLVKIDRQLATLAALRRFLVQHPALVWGLGFPLMRDVGQPYGFSAEKSLPTRQQLARVLRQLPNELLQHLLTAQVNQIQQTLPDDCFGQVVAFDTKHILAWVKENNPREFVEGRWDPARQPTGDPDCKLGVKRAVNKKRSPTAEGVAPEGLPFKEWYWGYASGIVVTKVPKYGEFVLAELTKPFNESDVSYFLPLMAVTEARLGFRPLYGTGDAAFDAFYVYDYFHKPDGAGGAMIPFNQPHDQTRLFNEEGLPLCQAGLAMPVRKTYHDHTKALIPHERAFYACPLLFPEKTAPCCPIDHKQWPKGGCTAQMPTSIGARLRHQLDRQGELYKSIYKQRTATERRFSRAKALGIERPKLRNQQSITNMNTLIYLLLNARAFLRAKDLLES